MAAWVSRWIRTHLLWVWLSNMTWSHRVVIVIVIVTVIVTITIHVIVTVSIIAIVIVLSLSLCPGVTL